MLEKLLYVVYASMVALGVNHIVALFLHGSWLYYSYMVVLVLFCSLVAVVVVIVQNRTILQKASLLSQQKGLVGVFVSLNIAILAFLMSDYVIDFLEYTYEMALEIARSGELYTTHPYMGSALAVSIPSRIQVLYLPGFYAAVAAITGMEMYTLLGHIVPIGVWLLSLLVAVLLADILYQHDVMRVLRFMIVYCIAFLVTRQIAGLFGYQLFFAGYAGETLRAIVLIPSMIYAVFARKPILVCMILFVEAMVVWTTYGIGYCFLTMLLSFIATRRVSKGERIWS
ncbi:MAG: hypothetical protein R3Y47_02725 [Lachnospiraceae bacterium]